MGLQLTSKEKQDLIEFITKYYSQFELRSLGRCLEISEDEYYNHMRLAQENSEVFVERVCQLSKQDQLFDLIRNNSQFRRGVEIWRKEEIETSNKVEEAIKEQTKSILHLSDIHIENMQQAREYRMQLKTDLRMGLGVEEIDFLVISGDIANTATKEEYDAAKELIKGIMENFKISDENIVIVPGNHDLNWDCCKEAVISSEGEEIEFDEEVYKLKFKNFNDFFYQPICKVAYPTEYDQQGILYKNKKEKIIFLGLNSAWQIDHINKQRASINLTSLEHPFDIIMQGDYTEWLKIAVFHHAVRTADSMNDEFLQLLIRQGFKICMHGHIHEAQYDFASYGSNKEIAIIGAGTFGAPTKEYVPGIPLQYNFIKLNQTRDSVKVMTRKKERIHGAWEADARWGDKDKPDTFYEIKISDSFYN